MTDCRVTCQTCRTDTGLPKTWRWLCEYCASECQDRHRAETGHQTDLTITTSFADTIGMTAAAALALKRELR